jgi:hypothetical protein
MTRSAGISEWRPGEELQACLARADHDLYGVKETLHREPAPEGRLEGSLLPST